MATDKKLLHALADRQLLNHLKERLGREKEETKRRYLKELMSIVSEEMAKKMSMEVKSES